MKNLLLEIENGVGYGYICYLENYASAEIYNFLNNFCMWGESTKHYDNYMMFELSENTKNFMLSLEFTLFSNNNNVQLITSGTEKYKNIIHSIFEEKR